jgi:hypothetical protein
VLVAASDWSESFAFVGANGRCHAHLPLEGRRLDRPLRISHRALAGRRQGRRPANDSLRLTCSAVPDQYPTHSSHRATLSRSSSSGRSTSQFFDVLLGAALAQGANHVSEQDSVTKTAPRCEGAIRMRISYDRVIKNGDIRTRWVSRGPMKCEGGIPQRWRATMHRQHPVETLPATLARGLDRLTVA